MPDGVARRGPSLHCGASRGSLVRARQVNSWRQTGLSKCTCYDAANTFALDALLDPEER
jgi:hypothetical protein